MLQLIVVKYKKMTIKRLELKIAGRLVNVLPDSLYLKLIFHAQLGYWPDLKHPKTFNETLQWLKLHDRRPEYTAMVDKVSAKDYVAARIGERYIIPTLGVWDNPEAIDWPSLPERFVIKTSNDSGGIIVCKDKSKLDVNAATAKLKSSWGNNYSKYNKEYPYEGVVPRIIAEEYLEDETEADLKDYKFFCFNGEPRFLFVASERQNPYEETKFDFFDTDWNHLPVRNGHPNSSRPIPRPEHLEEMLDIARRLSYGIPHVRVDLYNVSGRIYFGELTFFHWSGLMPFDPPVWDLRFGAYFNEGVSNSKD